MHDDGRILPVDARESGKVPHVVILEDVIFLLRCRVRATAGRAHLAAIFVRILVGGKHGVEIVTHSVAVGAELVIGHVFHPVVIELQRRRIEVGEPCVVISELLERAVRILEAGAERVDVLTCFRVRLFLPFRKGHPPIAEQVDFLQLIKLEGAVLVEQAINASLVLAVAARVKVIECQVQLHEVRHARERAHARNRVVVEDELLHVRQF